MCTVEFVNIQSLLSPVLIPGLSGTGRRRALSSYATTLPGITKFNETERP